jgi:hypothetical protein
MGVHPQRRLPLRSQNGHGPEGLHRGKPRVVHQQFSLWVDAGVIMRGRRQSRAWPATRGTPPRAPDADVETDAQTDEALRALARLLARQAVHEMFERESTDIHLNRSTDEGRQ